MGLDAVVENFRQEGWCCSERNDTFVANLVASPANRKSSKEVVLNSCPAFARKTTKHPTSVASQLATSARKEESARQPKLHFPRCLHFSSIYEGVVGGWWAEEQEIPQKKRIPVFGRKIEIIANRNLKDTLTWETCAGGICCSPRAIRSATSPSQSQSYHVSVSQYQAQ